MRIKTKELVVVACLVLIAPISILAQGGSPLEVSDPE